MLVLTDDLAHKLHGSVLGDGYVESGARLMGDAPPSQERLGGFEQLLQMTALV